LRAWWAALGAARPRPAVMIGGPGAPPRDSFTSAASAPSARARSAPQTMRMVSGVGTNELARASRGFHETSFDRRRLMLLPSPERGQHTPRSETDHPGGEAACADARGA